MSILIKGINPPESCNNCPFSIILDDLFGLDKFAFCIPLKEKICGPDSDIDVTRALCDKLSNCPIEPLPPNLKDVDKFKSDYYNENSVPKLHGVGMEKGEWNDRC